MTPNEFVKLYLPYARETQKRTGIDARFILAQAALETGWGSKAPGNMFFGVKTNPETTPEHQRQLITTREILSHPDAEFPQIISVTQLSNGKYMYVVKDWFRRYASPEESFTDHVRFFSQNKRYIKALTVKYDPYLFADAVAKAGYATDPNYAQSLKAVIRTVEKYME